MLPIWFLVPVLVLVLVFGCFVFAGCFVTQTHTLLYRSGNVYIFDLKDVRKPTLHKTVTAKEIAEKSGLSFPHTSHCLGSGDIMISFLGDKAGNGMPILF